MGDGDELLERVLGSVPASARATAASLEDGELLLEFTGGNYMTYALDLPPLAFLAAAEEEARQDMHIIGGGAALHWPQLDHFLFLPDLYDAYRDAHRSEVPWIHRRIFEIPEDMVFDPDNEGLILRMIPAWGAIIHAAKRYAAWGGLVAVVLLVLPRVWWLAVLAAIPVLNALVKVLSIDDLRAWLIGNEKSASTMSLDDGEIVVRDNETQGEIRQPLGATILSLFIFGAAPALIFWLCLMGASGLFFTTGSTVSSMPAQPWVSIVFIEFVALAAFVSMFVFRWLWGHVVLWKYWLQKLGIGA